MALNPGDSVGETCERVGNFPFSLLDDPTNLQLDTSSKTLPVPGGSIDLKHSLPLASFKQKYIDLFGENSLTVCAKDDFAKLNIPLQCSLGHGLVIGYVFGGRGQYAVHSLGPLSTLQKGNLYKWFWEQEGPFPGYPNWDGNGLIGEVTFDLHNGPTITHYTETTGFGSFYVNRTFKCEVKASYIIEGTGVIDEFGRPVYILHARLDAIVTDDFGEVTFTKEITTPPSAYPYIDPIRIDEEVITNIIGDTGESGTITKGVSVGFTMGIRDTPP